MHQHAWHACMPLPMQASFVLNLIFTIAFTTEITIKAISQNFLWGPGAFLKGRHEPATSLDTHSPRACHCLVTAWFSARCSHTFRCPKAAYYKNCCDCLINAQMSEHRKPHIGQDTLASVYLTRLHTRCYCPGMAVKIGRILCIPPRLSLHTCLPACADGWGWIDFLSTAAGYIQYLPLGEGGGGASGLRALRALRPLRALNAIPGEAAVFILNELYCMLAISTLTSYICQQLACLLCLRTLPGHAHQMVSCLLPCSKMTFSCLYLKGMSTQGLFAVAQPWRAVCCLSTCRPENSHPNHV